MVGKIHWQETLYQKTEKLKPITAVQVNSIFEDDPRRYQSALEVELQGRWRSQLSEQQVDDLMQWLDFGA